MDTIQPKIAVGTAIAASKLYTVPFLLQTVRSLNPADVFIGLDAIEPPENLSLDADRKEIFVPSHADPIADQWIPARIARVRSAVREAFLAKVQEEGYTHFYWHDSDVLPPADILTRLATHNVPIASGIYNLRHADGRVHIPASNEIGYISPFDFRHAPMSGFLGLRKENGCYYSGHFGMGCMLVQCEVMQKTGFAFPEFLAQEKLFEDIHWCVTSGHSVLLDPSISCWHVEENGDATRIEVGDPVYQIMWREETPIDTRFGRFEPGETRNDFSENLATEFGPGFDKGYYPRLSVETEHIDTLLANNKG